MTNLKRIKELIRKSGKRPSKEAIEKIKEILEEKIKEILEHAKRKADFAGRKTILKEDIE